MREVVLDTETTGLNFKSGDRVIEVGCVELVNHIPSGITLQFYCSTDKPISPEAQKITGLTNEFLKKFSSFEDNSQSFLDFIKDDVLIIHNSDFDIGFLNNELKILGKPKITNKVINTVSLARKKLNTRIANLDYLCRRFSIDLSKRDLHGALLDSHLLADVYLELIGGKQISMNLSSNEDNKKNNKKTANLDKLNLSQIQVTESQILEHKVIIKQIKNPLWEKIDY